MTTWQDYHTLHPGEKHTVTGTLKVLEDFHSPQLDNRRDILVYLPPSYEQGARCPVIYFHDGQNLFDTAASFVGEWCVDETLEALSADGLEAIAVGIPNINARRLDEYSPFVNAMLNTGGQGDAYLAFLVETLKPLIDQDFRTLPDRAHTGIMGSSMGGLISLYAYVHCPDVFGLAGIMSPAFWFADDDAIFTCVARAPFLPGKLYLDVGTAEMEDVPPDARHSGVTSQVYLDDARRMRELLLSKGYREERDLLYVEEAGAVHHESAWARRLPGALRFLLAADR
ncbi:MAG: alpha/beta hydrolase [Anaerolineae bacterium]|nr:alpha/beta hydrolase [Anaerolineae bacterium]